MSQPQPEKNTVIASDSRIVENPPSRVNPGMGGTGVSWRGILTGIIGVPITCFVVSWAEIKLKTLQIGYLQIPPAVVGILLVLLALNGITRALTRRSLLTPQDLLIGYSMMTVAAMISSRGLMEKLIPLLITPNYFADGGNEWRSLYFPYLKPWLHPFDLAGGEKQDVATRFFEGLRAGEPIPWQVWVGPLIWWSILALLIFGAFLCMAALLRKQWVDNEKLAFPLAQLPLEMTGFGDPKEVPLFKNRLMWLGFSIPFTIFMLKGLHTWYPSIPDITVEWNLKDFLTTPPWNGIYYTPIKISFAIIGFMFLLPSDLVFSLWFFFVLSRAQDVLATALNMDMPGMPMYPTPLYRGYQAMGAYLVLTVYLLWVMRPHLSRVWRTVTGESSGDDAQELISYRAAFWGFWVCALGAGGFLVMTGLHPLLALMQLGGLFFVIAFVMGRSTAEAGMLMTESSFRPVDLLRLFTPLHTLGPQNLTALALSDSLIMRDQRSLLLGGFLDGLRIADGAQIVRSRFAVLFIGAIVLSIVCAAIIQLWLPYTFGGVNLYGYVYAGNNKMGFDDYRQYLRPGALPVGWQGPTFLSVGMAFTGFLVWGRTNIGNFPFHPLGYALCSSWTMIVFWFSAFLAWLFKSLLLRYGGMKLYRAARPFFLGMILGEFLAALLWAVANTVFDTPVPQFTWA
ncbi:MAG: hypothetical protein OHK0029_41520 [Armatimonadaceae bacterium]